MSKAKELMAMAIADRNKTFDAMTKRERAVAVAEDVLAQLDLGKYNAEFGIYISVDAEQDLRHYSAKTSLQPILEENYTSCTVCAIGATFASTARLGNRVSVGDANENDGNDEVFVTRGNVAFTRREMRGMECVFEGRDVRSTFAHKDKVILSAKNDELAVAYNKYDEDEKNPYMSEDEFFMRYIMQNIIDNEGRFMIRGVKMSTNAPDKHS